MHHLKCPACDSRINSEGNFCTQCGLWLADGPDPRLTVSDNKGYNFISPLEKYFLRKLALFVAIGILFMIARCGT